MDRPTFAASIVINRPADVLYAMVSDVTRMGEWSPVTKACWWDEGHGPTAGSWFTGRNETSARTWETHCQVTAAEPGRTFAFAVQGTWILWSYAFEERDGVTTVTESWEFLPDGIARFHDRFGDDAPAEIASRELDARRGIPATLEAIKRVAEAS
jgi:hypothetical protein